MLPPSPASLSIFRHLFSSVAEEMGVTLGRAAYSPNIKERLDFSCAVFLGDGRLLAQAAHIPVHLGAMPASVQAAIAQCAPFHPDDVVILNDPYQGGNHLPDITLVSPIFIPTDGDSAPPHPLTRSPAHPFTPTPAPHFFVASRAHHADVGGMSPGSMPLSTEIFQEGIIIPPIKLVERGQRNEAVWQLILRNVRTPEERDGDLAAQTAAHTIGAQRLQEIVARYGLAETLTHADALIAYAARMTRAAVAQMPDGRFTFTDYLDNDGQTAVPICAAITIQGEQMDVDFSGTGTAVSGNLNAVPAIVQSAVAYCLRCVALALLQTDLPMNEGAFAPLTLRIPPGSLLDPRPPHAVAAGNVETSQRLVDVIFGALAQALPNLIPAASQGTMNNLTFGGSFGDKVTRWPGDQVTVTPSPSHPVTLSPSHPVTPTSFAYYETIGGGTGAGPQGDGASGVHVHMSNTRNTPIEALEYAFPLRVETYALRAGSGGNGRHRGGDGLIRTIHFLTPVTVSVISERRKRPSYGLQGGSPGKPGRNSLIRQHDETLLPGSITLNLAAGDKLRLETPGGGGWGTPETQE